MILRRCAVLGFLGIVLVGAGCKKTKGAPTDAGALVDAGRGLASTHNDKETIALAKAAAACPRDKPDAHFRALLDPECPELKTWEKSAHVMQIEDDDTLFNLIDDDDRTIRWLGASALTRASERWKKDKPKALRVLAATEAEKDKYVGYKLGLASAMIDLKATRLADRVVALIADTKRDPWLRGGVMATLGFNDRDAFPALRDAIEQVARKDDDAFLRSSAIQELWFHAGPKECALFLEFIHDPEDQVASMAAHGCVSKGCEADVEPLLSEIERRAKAGQAGDTFAWTLGEVGKSSLGLVATTRARLVSLAQEIVKNERNGGLARSRAIEVMVAIDPKSAAFAKKYASDSDALVAAAAKKLK